jgi:hypothetical protein
MAAIDMKKVFSISLFFALVLFLVACNRKMSNGAGDCMAVASGDTVIFQNNQAISLFTSCNKELQATVTNIMDSRCPKGVNCIWAGTVNVELQLNDQAVVNLAIGKRKDTVFNNRNYSFTLVNVVPYPGSSSDEPKSIIRIVQN